MQDLQQKKIWKTLRYSKLAILIYLLVTVYFITESIKFYEKRVKLNQKLDIVHMQVVEADRQLQDKQENVKFLSTDRGREQYLRETMPLAKTGEKVIILYDATNSPVQIMSTSSTDWEVFKKKFNYFINTYTNI
jgi:uncharacterized membrane protein